MLRMQQISHKRNGQAVLLVSYFFTYLLTKILLSLHLETLNICIYEYFYMKICISICIINNFYRYSSLSAFSKELYCNMYVCMDVWMYVHACLLFQELV